MTCPLTLDRLGMRSWGRSLGDGRGDSCLLTRLENMDDEPWGVRDWVTPRGAWPREGWGEAEEEWTWLELDWRLTERMMV